MAEGKYQLQLTGEQVDDALLQLNQRVAEGWAVGTRDGVPVGETFPYYQNNAKYYAQQAGNSAASASTSESNAAASAASASALIGGVPGLMYLSSENGHLYMTSLDGFNGSFSITRSNGHLYANFN